MSQQNALKRSTKTDFASSSISKVQERPLSGVFAAKHNSAHSSTNSSAAAHHNVHHQSGTSGLTRQRRSQTFSSNHGHHSGATAAAAAHAQAQALGKPAMEIYRPPNVRADGSTTGNQHHQHHHHLGGRLNVHAKEFTMHEGGNDGGYPMAAGNMNGMAHGSGLMLSGSKSSGNIHQILHHHAEAQSAHAAMSPIALQHSKSSGNMLRHPLMPMLSSNSAAAAAAAVGLMHSNSTSALLQHLHQQQAAAAVLAAAAAAAQHRVNFQLPSGHELIYAPTMIGYPNSASAHSVYNNAAAAAMQAKAQLSSSLHLKRSKSFTATPKVPEPRSLSTSPTVLPSLPLKGALKCALPLQIPQPIGNKEIMEGFNAVDQTNVQRAIDDPNQVPSRTLIDLVRVILERLTGGIRVAESAAKICMTIIERERQHTFIESLVNTCQQWYQERDKNLRGKKAGDGTRFSAFMWFLTEMCGQLKRRQLRTHSDSPEPDLVLLSVLVKCCQACVNLPIQCLAETECLFFVLTSIGRDLEKEMPAQLEQLMTNVRDAFLASAGSPAVRKTLLQLIELHASNWQLAGSSVLYYYSRK